MTKEELKMRNLIRESDVIDRTDGSELAKAFNYIWEKYVEQEQPCNDAVSRQSVLDIDFDRICLTTAKPAEMIRNRIKDLPSVQPKQKMGYWICTDKSHEHGKCSNCGYWGIDLVDGEIHNYCQNCGAKIIGVKIDEEQEQNE